MTGFKARPVLTRLDPLCLDPLHATTVKIVGAGHGSGFTSLKRARIWVARGVAEWVQEPNSIAFPDPLAFVQGKAGTHFDAKIPGAYQPYFGDSVGFAVLQMEHGLGEWSKGIRKDRPS